MADFTYQLGRRRIYFSDHSLDRWWARCKQNGLHGRRQALELLKERLSEARWSRDMPAWTRISLWNRSVAEGFIVMDENSGFVVNRNSSRDLVAVTYIEDVVANPLSYERRNFA